MPNSALISSLRRARSQQLSIFEDLSAEEMLGQQEHHLEPPIWEMGHIIWFQELYLLRGLDDKPSFFPKGDSMYDSFHVSYKKRWSHDFPSKKDTLSYGKQVLDAAVARLGTRHLAEQERELYQLMIAHEQMHTENLMAMRRNLGFGKARPVPPPAIDENYTHADIACSGGLFPLGASQNSDFVLDNEQWQHTVEIEPFSIANLPVTNAQFIEFLDSDAYATRSLWTKDGWNWRRRANIDGPLYWKKIDGAWHVHHYDRWLPAQPWHPLCHVNLHEARAFCEFAQRRLPTEAEWEMAASWDEKNQQKRKYPWGDSAPDASRVHMDLASRSTIDVREKALGDSALGCRQMLGNVWEWTSSKLTPYPGFEPGAYQQYSLPYLGKKPVLRGGSWATSPELIRNTWRNFFIKHRRNIFAGIRTCAR